MLGYDRRTGALHHLGGFLLYQRLIRFGTERGDERFGVRNRFGVAPDRGAVAEYVFEFPVERSLGFPEFEEVDEPRKLVDVDDIGKPVEIDRPEERVGRVEHFE